MQCKLRHLVVVPVIASRSRNELCCHPLMLPVNVTLCVLLRGSAGEFGLMNYYSFDSALLHITLCILGVAIDRPLYHRAVVRVYVQLLDLIDVSKRLLSMLDHISLRCV
jgi:hypothetical protein